MTQPRAWTFAVCVLAVVTACREQRINLLRDPVDASVAMRADTTPSLTHDTGAHDAAMSGTTAPDAGHIPSALCGKEPCACDDGLDNDNDGLRDGLDPECTGPFDNDEISFGIGKANKQSGCRDCFWDDNAGSGDDGCRYPVECLRGTAPNNNGNCSSCQVSARCTGTCRARTPNGCDCFGCCQVTHQGLTAFVELEESCTLDHIDDPIACPRCIQNTACANPCGRCELCLGKRTSDLPPDCAAAKQDTGIGYACDEGERVCAGSVDCAGASYCQLGCCLVELL